MQPIRGKCIGGLIAGALIAIPTLLATAAPLCADDNPIRVHGYFQNIFNYDHNTTKNYSQSTFSMQQLNLMFHKDISTRWAAFVNLQLVNSFSSFKDWGSINLEEAWIRYSCQRKFHIKLGLQIPIFNRNQQLVIVMICPGDF